MPSEERGVVIAGGGIGGLSAAIALAARGIASTVLERSNFGDETGAGIQLGPNAARALQELDLLDDIAAAAATPEAICLFDAHTNRRLSVMPLGDAILRRYGVPYLTLHRADLHAALFAKAQTVAEIKSGAEIFDIASDAEGVDVHTKAGRSQGSCLVGADGIWSMVRDVVAPDAQLRFGGATAWRTLLANDGLPSPFGDNIVGVWMGRGAHLVHYPVRNGRQVNAVVVIDQGDEGLGWHRAIDAGDLLQRIGKWAPVPRRLLEQAVAWRGWALYRLPPLTSWSRGNVVLLGDAAHPVLPFLAQGAALAIEDAVTVAKCMAASRDSLPSAFRRYEALRNPRVTQVQRASWRFGRIYHAGFPLRASRNLVLSARRGDRMLARFDWLYGGAV